MTDSPINPDQGGPNACVWCNRTVTPGDQAEEIQDEHLHKLCQKPWEDEYARELTPEEQEAELHIQRKEQQNELRKEWNELIKKLEDKIWKLWSRTKDDDYHIGEMLFALQELLAKPGYGTFVQHVTQVLDIPMTTAYRKIDRYESLEAKWKEGYDTAYWPVRGRLYLNGKDDNSWPVEDLDEKDSAERRVILEAAVEQKERELAEIITRENEKIERAKAAQKGRVSRFNIFLLLAPPSEKNSKPNGAEWMKRCVRKSCTRR